MSHEIKEHDQQEGRTMAWHGLTLVNPNLTLENCHLNGWDYVPEVVKIGANNVPTRFRMLGVSDGAMVPLNPDNEVSELNPLVPLIIGDSYDVNTFKPILHKRIIPLLIKATEGKDLFLASCGSIKNRGRHYWSFQLGEQYRSGGRDFTPFLNIGNGNDQSSPLWQNTSNTCTVCNNTFQLNSLGAGLIMEVKKTKFSELALGDFSQAMKAILAGQREFAQMFDALATTAVTEEAARQFLAGFFAKAANQPLSAQAVNNIDFVIELFKTGDGNEGKTLADLFSGLTDFYTHFSASGKKDEGAKWKNFVSSEFGAGKDAKQKAWTAINVDSQRNNLRKMGIKVLKITQEKAAADEAAKVQRIEAGKAETARLNALSANQNAPAVTAEANSAPAETPAS